MPSVNHVILVGNLGRAPELRSTSTGSAVCTVTLATSRRWRDRESGLSEEEVEWHRVVFFDRLAEVAGKFLTKGKQVYVEGRLKTQRWTDKDGTERYSTDVVADKMEMLGARGTDLEGGHTAAGNTPAGVGAQGHDAEELRDVDIPF